MKNSNNDTNSIFMPTFPDYEIVDIIDDLMRINYIIKSYVRCLNVIDGKYYPIKVQAHYIVSDEVETQFQGIHQAKELLIKNFVKKCYTASVAYNIELEQRLRKEQGREYLIPDVNQISEAERMKEIMREA